MSADFWIPHNCQNKECYLGIIWDANNHQIDLALMEIDESKLNDLKQYKWQHQTNQINYRIRVGLKNYYNSSIVITLISILIHLTFISKSHNVLEYNLKTPLWTSKDLKSVSNT